MKHNSSKQLIVYANAQAQQKNLKVGELLVGNKIPHEFFVVQGSGESDIGYHPGAFDIALEKAGGIHNFNLVSYSSVLPQTAVRINEVPKEYEHGAVLETIMAEAGKGLIYPRRLTAGIIVTKVFSKEAGEDSDECIGGLVAEYHGNGTREQCAKFLKANMDEMVKRRYGEDVTINDELFIETIEPHSKFACAIVVLGFTSYKVPVLNMKAQQQNH